MIKKISITIIVTLLLAIATVTFLSIVGIETTKFNNFIKNELKSYNNKTDINLKKVKLKLDLNNFYIKINTLDPTLYYNSIEFPLEKLSFSIAIKSYLNEEFGIKKASIETKYNKITNFLNTYQSETGSVQFFILSKTLKKGDVKFVVDFEFDENGKINNNYIINGEIKDTKIKIFKDYDFNHLNFDFKIKKNNYEISDASFNFNNINFNSKKISIIKNNAVHQVIGEIDNKDGFLNDKILHIFSKNYENYLDIDNSKITSNSSFSFDITKDFKIKKLKTHSKVKIDKLRYLSKNKKIKKYLPDYQDQIYLVDSLVEISYFKNNYKFEGSTNYLLKDLYDKLNFKISKLENQYNFNFDINFEKNQILIEELNYLKKINSKSNLKLVGKYIKNKQLTFQNIKFVEEKNNLQIVNLFLNKNFKIIKFDKVVNNYLTKDQIKNDYSIVFKNPNYKISGITYDGIKLLDNMFESSDDNVFNIFENLNSKITIDLKQVYIDKVNYLDEFKASAEFKNNKIKNLVLDSVFPNKKELKLTINTAENGEKVTTVFTNFPKPIVSRYKFIKGFEKGTLDFQSIKKNGVSKSVLKIFNFKVKDVPALAKLLSLASLQGIADTLTGEGIRFTDFEMIFSNEAKLMTIDEIYAIGPAISILSEGYIEKDSLISLRGTLVPARTINRTISSIPLLGDILVGKKVGEGVFGVSFKVKGPPKNLKTTVNPIKTLTPRFITRTLEKIKKN
tara:strand:- start:1073 stop:3274 length:2202 start_codon:yes stop_codon:yes gene_type:complete